MNSLGFKLIHCAFLLLICSTSKAEWQLQYQKNDIEIYSQEVLHSDYIKIKASLVIRDQLQQFYQFLSDPKLAPKWLDKVNSSQRLARLDDTTVVVLTIFEGFGPIAEREMLTRSQTVQNDDGFVVNISSFNQYQPKSEQRVRVENATVQWQVNTLADGLLKVTYIGYFEPGGKLPAWLSNHYALKSIKTTFLNLQRLKPKRQSKPSN